MSRLKQLTREEMTAEQRRVADEIMGGPRGGSTGLQGPFNAWMRALRRSMNFCGSPSMIWLPFWRRKPSTGRRIVMLPPTKLRLSSRPRAVTPSRRAVR
mgnify:CR=1 FL=1